jgi:hypothetical protein
LKFCVELGDLFAPKFFKWQMVSVKTPMCQLLVGAAKARHEPLQDIWMYSLIFERDSAVTSEPSIVISFSVAWVICFVHAVAPTASLAD